MNEKLDKMISVLQAMKLPGAKLQYLTGRGYENAEKGGVPNFQMADYQVLIHRAGKTVRLGWEHFSKLPPFWVRSETTHEYLVVRRHTQGFETSMGWSLWESHPFTSYSTDGVTWHPFNITEPGDGWEVVASTEESK
jgi:hypothetical protein